VPCYKLRECHDSAPAGLWRNVPVVGPAKAARAFFHTLYNTRTGLYEAFWPYEEPTKAIFGL
jgi:hypothetical protein